MTKTREEFLSTLKITDEDLVLEIGGGNLPYWRSDVYLERYIFDNRERAGDLVIDRPLICADAHFLPFRTNSFDFIFCSQVLEHLEKPDMFLDELVRVGKRGYIEAPTELRERLIRQPFHRWVIAIENNILILQENRLPEIFGHVYRTLMGNEQYYHFYRNNYSLFNHMFEWEGKIDFRFGSPAEHDPSKPSEWLASLKLTPDKIQALAGTSHLSGPGVKMSFRLLHRAVIRYIKRILIKKKKSPRKMTSQILYEIFICPVCKNPITKDKKNHSLECKKCSRHYPIIDGIPILLSSEKEIEKTLQEWKTVKK